MATVMDHAARLVVLAEEHKQLMEEKARYRAELEKTFARWDATSRARSEINSTPLEAALDAVSNIRGIA